jgi:hypothetical protein
MFKLAIHKLKINLSNIIVARHPNVELVAKEDYLLDFVHHSSWKNRSPEISLCY